MNNKGITPIVEIVLLLMLTVAVAGVISFWLASLPTTQNSNVFEKRVFEKRYYVIFLANTPNGLEMISKSIELFSEDEDKVIFSIEDFVKFMTEDYDYQDVVILNFIELKEYEIFDDENFEYDIRIVDE